ncbi:MAG: hypothetical protein QM784_33870 [Polyangiaceae bacterium]
MLGGGVGAVDARLTAGGVGAVDARLTAGGDGAVDARLTAGGVGAIDARLTAGGVGAVDARGEVDAWVRTGRFASRVSPDAAVGADARSATSVA